MKTSKKRISQKKKLLNNFMPKEINLWNEKTGYSIKEVLDAGIFKCCRRTILNRIKNHTIPAEKIGNQWIIKSSYLKKII